MRAYYYDNIEGDQRLPHDYSPSRPVSDETLKAMGVEWWTIPVEGYQAKLDAVAEARGYKNRDQVDVSKTGMGDAYEQRIKTFFSEHMHEDEEIRYVIDGTGYYDIRESPTDNWIRIAVTPGDLIILPDGIYHRFTLDTNNALQAVRLFQGEPKWIPHDRSEDTDANPHRLGYLKSIGVAA